MELSSIESNNNGLPARQKENAMQVAKEFESMFTSMLLKSMRNTVNRGDLIPENTGEDIYTTMLDTEYSKVIANTANFGLADQIYKQMEQSNDFGMLTSLEGLLSQPSMFNPAQSFSSNQPFSAEAIAQKIAPYKSIIDEASKEYSVDPRLISAVIAQESGGNPFAVSHAGAKGLMQLIDSTATQMQVTNVFNPRENIMGGTKYLSSMLKEFSGNETLALASYNAGLTAVKKYGGIPPYRETQDYVARVLRMKNSLGQQTNLNQPISEE